MASEGISQGSLMTYCGVNNRPSFASNVPKEALCTGRGYGIFTSLYKNIRLLGNNAMSL